MRSIEYTQMPDGQLSYKLFSESGDLQQSGTTTREAADSGLFGADTSDNYNVSYTEPEPIAGVGLSTTSGGIRPSSGLRPSQSFSPAEDRPSAEPMPLPSNLKYNADGNIVPSMGGRMASDLRGIEVDRQLSEVGYSDMASYNAANEQFGNAYDSEFAQNNSPTPTIDTIMPTALPAEDRPLAVDPDPITYDLLQDDAGFSNYTGSALDQVAEIQSNFPQDLQDMINEKRNRDDFTVTSNTSSGTDYSQPQRTMGGTLAPGYYSGPADGVYKYGEGPFAGETQKFLDDNPDYMTGAASPIDNVAQGVSSFGDMSSNDMQRMLNRGSISQGSVSEVQQMIDSPQPVTPPAPATAEPVAANPVIDVLGTGSVFEPGSSDFAAPSQGDYNFGVQDTFTPDMMSQYQSAFSQIPSFGQAMPAQQAMPQGGLGSLGQSLPPLKQFNVSGSFNSPPIKSPYV
mgnify:CR=1 FL=1